MSIVFFNHDNSVSLIDVLKGNGSPEDLIKVDERTGLHLIYSKPMQAGDADILSAGNMKLLIDSLRDSYDTIILDSPPCLAVADSRVLAKMADKTLYLVRWDNTARETVHSGLTQMSRDKIDIAGFVISRVDLKKHARYNYGDMSTYYQTYHAYFKN